MDAKKKTNGRRNRSAGHDWEREIAILLKDRKLYPDVTTTRNNSHVLDDQGIDFMNRDESKQGVMDDTISAKSYSRALNYAVLLERLEESGRPHPVIFHKQTKRAMTGTRFLHRGSYAITDIENYLELMACRKLVVGLRQKAKILGRSVSAEEISKALEELGLW